MHWQFIDSSSSLTNKFTKPMKRKKSHCDYCKQQLTSIFFIKLSPLFNLNTDFITNLKLCFESIDDLNKMMQLQFESHNSIIPISQIKLKLIFIEKSFFWHISHFWKTGFQNFWIKNHHFWKMTQFSLNLALNSLKLVEIPFLLHSIEFVLVVIEQFG